MKSDFAHHLEILLQNSLLISSEVKVLSEDGFSELEIRSLGNHHVDRSNWYIKVTIFNELTLFDFSFDDSAKNWNDFYLNELNKGFELWFNSLKSLAEKNFEFNFLVDGRRFGIEDFHSDIALGRFEIKSKLRLNQNPTNGYMIPYLDAIRDFVGICTFPLIPAEVETGTDVNREIDFLPEGALTKVMVNRYERSPKNRAACLAHYGFQCFCCGFDFGIFYGDFADSFIHVHHRTPVSELGENYLVDPINDLIPLCPNCHAAIHLDNPPIDPIELRELIRSRKVN